MVENNQIKKVQKPVKIFVLDTETRGLEGEIFKVGLYNGERYWEANTFEKIKKRLRKESITYDVHIYIHNLNFDMAKIVHEMEEEILLSESLFINGISTTLKTFYFTFHDSMQLITGSLKSLCDDFDVKDKKIDLVERLKKTPFNIQYKKKPITLEELNTLEYEELEDFLENRESTLIVDYKKTQELFFKTVSPDNPLLKEYLKYDCVSLYEILMTLLGHTKLKVADFVKCPTTASLSMKIFKMNFPDQYEMAISSNFYGHNIIDELFLREGYSGGRTEVFREFGRDLFHYDVNSLYPYVCRKYSYPVGNHWTLEEEEAELEWERFLFFGEFGGMVKATVNIPDMYLPVLPYRCLKRGKLIFPVGTITHTWTMHELKFAMERGVEVVKVHKTISFEKMSNIFIGFVNQFEKIKKENKEKNKSLSNFAKRILNALYGKFAMIRERDNYISQKEIPGMLEKMKKQKAPDENTIEFFELVLEHGGQKAMEIYYSDEDSEKSVCLHYPHEEMEEDIFIYPKTLKSEYVQVQISAYVTSYARMELYQTMEWVLKNKGHIYYCDTDSLVSSIRLPADLVDKLEFGKWDLEDELEEGLYLQAKFYWEKTKEGIEKVKAKGIPEDKRKELTGKDFKYLAEERRNGTEYVKLLVKEEGFQNLIKMMSAWKGNKSFNHMYLIEKGIYLKNELNKRNLLEDGNTTPWRYDGTEENNIEEFIKELEEENWEQREIDYLGEMVEENQFIKIPNRNTKVYEYYYRLPEKVRRKYFRSNGIYTIEKMVANYDGLPEEELIEHIFDHYHLMY
jgi:hypothetical protein